MLVVTDGLMVTGVELTCCSGPTTPSRISTDRSTPAGSAKATMSTSTPSSLYRIAFVNGVKPDQLAHSAARDVTLPLRGNSVTLKGEWYLKHFALPNFYFHVATAYDILRHNGVELAKADFIGALD